MDSKKSVAVSISALLIIFLFAIIGSTFIEYLYKNEKVEIKNPRITMSDGIVIKNTKNETIHELDFSEIKLGLKPVTGELDVKTKIPVTVNDKNGSEGIFTKFIVDSLHDCNIYIKNLVVIGNDSLEIQKERENIWFSVVGIEDSTKNFKEDVVNLGTILASSEGKEYTLLMWFSSVASEDFESSKISFEIEFK